MNKTPSEPVDDRKALRVAVTQWLTNSPHTPKCPTPIHAQTQVNITLQRKYAHM